MEQIEWLTYLHWLLKWKDQQIIKVVTGMRRCGKSTLFAMYQDYLLTHGVTKEQIVAINFKDLTDYKALYNYIKNRLLQGQMNYLFLDEVHT